jgi:plasminogen activator inhibitor 1 RNA-binding protein
VRAEKKEKVYLEIDAHFDRPTRGGGRGRGDRGRGRDRGARGRRGTNGTQPTVSVNVEDETAFPSLS